MNHTLLIHIGMPKTGTTALQNFLLQNDDILQKYEWRYPILCDNEMLDISDIESSGNAYDIYNALIYQNDRKKWNKGIEIVLKYLQNSNVIISAEGISINGIEQFISGAKEKHEQIKVVIYLRRQDREVESMYNQHIKIGKEYGTFNSYIESDNKLKQCVRYLSKLDSLSQIIGRENLIVRIYEKQQLIGNDIVTDFLSVLGIPPEREEWIKSEKTNPSMQGNYLEIRRLVNSLQGINASLNDSNYIWKGMKTECYDVGVKLSRSYKDKREHGFFTLDERRAFLARYAAENEQIAREYLQREDGRLFYDDIVDYPLYPMQQDDSFEADMVRMFTALLYKQRQEMEYLIEKNSRELIGKFLMKDVLGKSAGRKLCVFGAGYKCRKLFDTVKDISVAMIADNDTAKDGTTVNGVSVKYAKNIANWQEHFIIVTCEKTDEIEEQLGDLGLKKGEDYLLMREYGL